VKIKTQATIFVIVDTSEWDLDNVDPQTLHGLVADALSAHRVVDDEDIKADGIEIATEDAARLDEIYRR
jgi:hypothetical protein